MAEPMAGAEQRRWPELESGGGGGGGGRSRGRERRRWSEPRRRGGRGWRWCGPEPEEGAAAVVEAREEGVLGCQWSSRVDVEE
uniref:Uncharacterized protein n=1 Tax=Oryza sativa subsp. japonica TaxID=39947 RepID=Q75KA2_ORYSJ|nr:hypothetical protein [Oryza sativa Japonica Group]